MYQFVFDVAYRPKVHDVGLHELSFGTIPFGLERM